MLFTLLVTGFGSGESSALPPPERRPRPPGWLAEARPLLDVVPFAVLLVGRSDMVIFH